VCVASDRINNNSKNQKIKAPQKKEEEKIYLAYSLFFLLLLFPSFFWAF
jgi:hypothetical protein